MSHFQTFSYLQNLDYNKPVNTTTIKADSQITENKLVVISGERGQGQYKGEEVGASSYWV